MNDAFRSLLQKYSKDCPSMFLKEGEYLVRQNDPAEFAYVVVTGRMHAVLESEKNKKQVVAEIGPGETVGEMSVITGRARSTSVIAARDSELRRVAKRDFENILLQNPQFLLELTRLIALRLDNTTRLRKIEFTPKNIVFMPIGAGSANHVEFVKQFLDVLSKKGRVITLDSQAATSKLREMGLREATEEKLNSNSDLVGWFNNIEDQNDFVVCITQNKMDWWTKRCLRSADRIYLVAHAEDDPRLSDVETQMQSSILQTGIRRELILCHKRGKKHGINSARWFSGRQVTSLHHFEEGNKDHIERQVRFLLGKSIGLVLGGGGAKGLAHLGVIRAMRELKIPIDRIGGTSAGSIVAGLHALGLNVEEQIESFKRLATNYNLRKFTFPWLSLFSRSGIDKALVEFFDDHHIEDLFTQFFCISCNLNTAQKVVHDQGLLRDAIRASTSIPGVYPPTLFGHNLLIDGGIMDNVPAQEMRIRGSEIVIAVDVASRNDLNVDPSLDRMPTGWEMLLKRMGRDKKNGSVPNVIEILMRTLLLNSINRSSETVSQASLALHPPVDKINMLDFSKPEATQKIGYDYAKPKLEAFINSNEHLLS